MLHKPTTLKAKTNEPLDSDNELLSKEKIGNKIAYYKKLSNLRNSECILVQNNISIANEVDKII